MRLILGILLTSSVDVGDVVNSGSNPFALFGQAGFLFLLEKRFDFVNSLPVIDMVATGKNIAILREEAGYSVRQLQSVMGFSTPQAIYKWQRGESMPSLDNLSILAAILRVKLDDIIIYKAI